MSTNDNTRFRLPKMNLYLIAGSLAVIVLGLILMAVGPDSAEGSFEPDIFSTRRIVVGPMVVFAGFLSMVVSILFPFKQKSNDDKA